MRTSSANRFESMNGFRFTVQFVVWMALLALSVLPLSAAAQSRQYIYDRNDRLIGKDCPGGVTGAMVRTVRIKRQREAEAKRTQSAKNAKQT